ncbi:MAG: ATP-binding protein [Sandaracinaceae bacterium]|nr:ATP-binding protein [Sandaracinaceae bacterium]
MRLDKDELRGRSACRCERGLGGHAPRRVVVTGGPGAGKTAVLEVVRAHFCEHVIVLPEAASIVFGGGFPRRGSESARRGAQRAIYHVQDQLERIELDEHRAAIVLCDRGVVDGAAYWPGPPAQYWEAVGETAESALARYDAVVHLRTPELDSGYDHSNPLRVESATEASLIDRAILALWEGHPRRAVVEGTSDFVAKLRHALDAIEARMPSCCQSHTTGLFR